MAKQRTPPIQPAGGGKHLQQAILEKGSDLLQDVTPVKEFDIYVVGFHCAKHDPQMQMEAHHYCKQVNGDLLQCLIFDGNSADANLIGIEYIISENLYETLPAAEKQYWHPHNFEIFSGQLVAPGLPDAAEKAMLKFLINSYGKTWHVWHTGRHDGAGEPGHALPFGEPVLMWSFNRDGEVDATLEQNRNEAMEIEPQKKRAERRDYLDLAHPQYGVDTLKAAFPHAAATPPPGVQDAGPLPDHGR
jgi:hypothetical protein